ncbi:MAG: F420-non-reducing hydrogenase vhu subunit G [Candidatus Thorarchaeota archaeon]|nr:MAG: F420-non-reducing hydrogenase vhu subunit G [Candidatus Thorarchaeota archaeon]
MIMAKRIALAQLTSCWGCDQSLVDLHLTLLEVLPQLEIVYWPAVVDYKLKDLEAMPDESIHIGLVEGSCRTKEDVHLLKLMRKKAKILVAWGSCSCYGGVQGLGNQWELKELLERKFLKADTVEDGRIPEEEMPGFTESVVPNTEIVKFDVPFPGCPPTSENTLEALSALLTGKPYDLPEKTVCDQCPKERKEKSITKFKRAHEGHIDPDKCLLDQGYLCLGFATIGMCGAQCPTVNTPCKGCFGPPPGIKDHGAKIISALGAIADMDPEELEKAFPDPIGSFYFTDYGASYLSKIRDKEREEK